MRKLEIAIVEDNEQDVKKLVGVLTEYAARRPQYEFEIKAFSSGIAFLDSYRGFDVVFMDIEMPTMDGMAVCRKLRELDKGVALIFVTNMSQYAIDGYSVNAFDFVVKPFTYQTFAMRFDRLMTSLSRYTEKKIKIKSQGALLSLELSNVKYVEVFNYRLVYHTFDGEFEVLTQSLSEVEPLLLENGFFKISRSIVLNLKWVSKVTDCEIDVDGDKLYIARRRKKDFLKALTEYLGGSDA